LIVDIEPRTDRPGIRVFGLFPKPGEVEQSPFSARPRRMRSSPFSRIGHSMSSLSVGIFGPRLSAEPIP